MQGENGFACSGRRDNEVRVRFYSSLPRRRTVSPAAVVAATSSASDSNFLSCKEEWPACIGRRGNDLPRPILIFFAATENGSACSCRRGDDLPHPILIFVVAKKNGSPASAVAGRSSASDSNLRRCKEEWFRLQRLSRQRGLCPILIFVAAKKNGPPAAAVAATIFRVRF